MAEFAIETINLIKRYPTSSRRLQERGHPPPGPPPPGPPAGGMGFHGPPMMGGFFALLKGSRGPFIEALRGVNLQVKKGEILGILGPNGAGKTTLIKILCTLVIHDEGEVYVCGIDVKKEPRKVLKMLQAVLPESRGFNWRLSGRQNLEFYALLYGLQDAEAAARIKYLLEFTGLEERAEDGYQRYSTGMQRKLLLCRALLRNTPVLLFDEPTAGLDPRAGAEFRTMLHDKLAREEGKTILFSTHNLEEAQSICDRIAILDHGQITALDTPDNIRYTKTEGIQHQISFGEGTAYDEACQALVSDLEKTIGVHSATPDVDFEQNLRGISLYLDKDMDLSYVLDTILKCGLKIKAINSIEPTLEDAFKTITKQAPEFPQGLPNVPGMPPWMPGGFHGHGGPDTFIEKPSGPPNRRKSRSG
ncbi:MAG TPA: ABC transporter ATP-binding protein [Candidatus Lokiarchaeia archaeon]|nr:ABC transporter ATP-binding protein [Candidatus Lokiarchaeia archaeon]